MKIKGGVKIRLSALILMLLPSLVFAAVVRISWNPNTEGDLAGYRVYYGTAPSSYDHVIGTGYTPSVDVISLEQGVTYYFAVTALDTSGNQSGFSQEVSITIPTGTGTGTGTGTDTDTGGGTDTGGDNLFDTVVQWVANLIREALGLDPDDPLYTMADSHGDGSQPAEPPSAIDMGGFSRDKANDPAGLEEYYPVRDVVLEENMSFDLTAIYPDGVYYFYPVEDTCPSIDGDILIAGEPGRYLYVVFDEVGSVLHVLRISVVQELYQLQTYDPAASLMLVDHPSGIAVDIPFNATTAAVPIAIGWGGDRLFPVYTQIVEGENVRFFDLLPYGLMLQEPAVVYMPCKGERAYVEYYDEKTGTWVKVEDVQITEGLLSFSTQVLGRFMVSVPKPEDGSDEFPYEGRESVCFVESARGARGQIFYLDNLPSIFSIISRRLSSFSRRSMSLFRVWLTVL